MPRRKLRRRKVVHLECLMYCSIGTGPLSQVMVFLLQARNPDADAITPQTDKITNADKPPASTGNQQKAPAAEETEHVSFTNAILAKVFVDISRVLFQPW